MLSPEIELSAETNVLFKNLTCQVQRGLLGHALLFYGAASNFLEQQILRLTQIILCLQPSDAPCGQCQSCKLVVLRGHPDMTWVAPEKKRSMIKIDSIRALNEVVYRSPQLSPRRVVLIQSADRMNPASGNALLKLLEEPPADVYFILQAPQLSTILPTILSRCQKWKMTSEHAALESIDAFLNDSSDPDWTKMVAQLPDILRDMQQVLTQQTQVCSLAAKWAAFDLMDVATVLYWLNAMMIYQQMGVAQRAVNHAYDIKWPRLPLSVLFQQMDTLNELMKQLNQGISMNALLTLEHFLLGYLG